MAYADTEEYSYSRSLTSMVHNQMHDADILYQLETQEDLLSSLFSLTISKSSPVISQKKVVVNEQVETSLISMLANKDKPQTTQLKSSPVPSNNLDRISNLIEFLGIAAGLWYFISQAIQKLTPEQKQEQDIFSPTENSFAEQPIIPDEKNANIMDTPGTSRDLENGFDTERVNLTAPEKN
mmetsp:Transcript_41500/g.63349  ORF Transcript_41500/g.63349 Transcript_41500/m.63349 type:complete len:181 (+) Transcript_41500:1507-2049(+)